MSSNGDRTLRRRLDRSPVGRLGRAVLRRPLPVRTSRVRGRARPLDELRLFAVLGTWMEADVVEACVRNALAQGVEEVFLVDNDSPDDTVAVAVAAGASLAVSYSTRWYDEQMRIDLMNGVMRQVSFASGAEHAWWLWLDADEFPHGPGGSTIRELLTGLDRRFRVVGARYFEHYPSNVPAYVPGTHPLDAMPLCEEHPYHWCAADHHKHPLMRVDAAGPPVTARRGFHLASASDVLLEPEESIFVHHFPYREETTTRARLTELCVTEDAAVGARSAHHEAAEIGAPQDSNMSRRMRSLDAVFGMRWDDVERPRTIAGDGQVGVRPRPWSEQVAAADAVVARWYGPAA
jgi:hypothetical protein